MAKHRSKSEVEHLRGIIREQKSEIRNLRKEISRSNKERSRMEHLSFMDEDEEVISIPIEDVSIRCPECSEPLTITALGARELRSCTNCKYRKTIAKKK